MRRTAILLGAGLLFAAPVTDAGLRFLSGHAALAALDRMTAGYDGFSASHISFDPWRGTLRVDNLALRAPALSIRIGHLTYAPQAASSFLASAAMAQQNGAKTHDLSSTLVDAARTAFEAGKISAENIVIDSDEATYEIPRIEIAGTDLREDELTALFDAKNSAPIGERFARISAARIAIPEVTIKFKNSPTTGDVVYRDIELNNVVKSRVAEGTMKSLSANLVAPEGATLAATCGPVTAKDFDIAQNAKIMSEAGKAAEEPKPLYSSLTVGKCKITSDSKSDSANVRTVVEIDSISASEVKGRPPRQSLASAKELFDANRQDSDDPDLLAKRSAYLSDIYASYEAGLVEMANLRVAGTSSGGASFSGSFAKISLAHFAASRVGEIRFDDLNFDANGTKLTLGSVAMRGIDLANIGKLGARKPNEPKKLLPVLDQFLLEGLDVATNYGKTDATTHGRFQLAKFDMTSAASINGIPTRFAAVLDHFAVDIGTLKSLGIQISDIAALGYDKLDLSSRLAMNFDAGKQVLGLEDFSLSGKDMGATKLSGQFRNVSEDVFSPDQTIAEAALLAALIDRVEVKIENAGLFERIIAEAAKKEGKSADEIRRDYIADVSVSVPSMLENGRGAKLIAAALAKFVATPKNFHLIARAPDGFGASDFALIKTPATLMERLEIEATANE